MELDPVLLNQIKNNDKSLTSLRLGGNQIGDKGAEHLANVLKTNTSLTSLYLGNNNIGEIGLGYLASALKINTSLNSLDIWDNKIGNKGAEYLATVLKINTSLTSLTLYNNEINEKGAEYLTDALKTNSSLTFLNLESNKIGEKGAEYLATMLKTNIYLTSLNITNNKIGEKGVEYLANALKQNNSLTSLNLWNNKIGEKGVEHVATALKTNTSLTSLNLRNNEIGEKGVEYLTIMLKTNTSLTSLNLWANKIGEKGAEYLANMLKINISLTSLNLESNKIGEKGVEYIATALKRNNYLTSFYLGNNNIGEKGAEYLANMLKTNTSLIFIDLRNNEINEKGAEYLVIVLKTNNSLTSIDLSFNKIGDNLKKEINQLVERNKNFADQLLSSINYNNIDQKNMNQIQQLLDQKVSPMNTDKNNNTALHLATINENSSIVKLLLKYNVSLFAKNNDAKTPLDLALNNPEILSLLQAKINRTNNSILSSSSSLPPLNFNSPQLQSQEIKQNINMFKSKFFDIQSHLALLNNNNQSPEVSNLDINQRTSEEYVNIIEQQKQQFEQLNTLLNNKLFDSYINPLKLEQEAQFKNTLQQEQQFLDHTDKIWKQQLNQLENTTINYQKLQQEIEQLQTQIKNFDVTQNNLVIQPYLEKLQQKQRHHYYQDNKSLWLFYNTVKGKLIELFIGCKAANSKFVVQDIKTFTLPDVVAGKISDIAFKLLDITIPIPPIDILLKIGAAGINHKLKQKAELKAQSLSALTITTSDMDILAEKIASYLTERFTKAIKETSPNKDGAIKLAESAIKRMIPRLVSPIENTSPPNVHIYLAQGVESLDESKLIQKIPRLNKIKNYFTEVAIERNDKVKKWFDKGIFCQSGIIDSDYVTYSNKDDKITDGYHKYFYRYDNKIQDFKLVGNFIKQNLTPDQQSKLKIEYDFIESYKKLNHSLQSININELEQSSFNSSRSGTSKFFPSIIKSVPEVLPISTSSTSSSTSMSPPVTPEQFNALEQKLKKLEVEREQERKKNTERDKLLEQLIKKNKDITTEVDAGTQAMLNANAEADPIKAQQQQHNIIELESRMAEVEYQLAMHGEHIGVKSLSRSPNPEQSEANRKKLFEDSKDIL